MRGVVGAVAVVIALAGCTGGAQPRGYGPSERTRASEPTAAVSGTVSMSASCPKTLPDSGLPTDWEEAQAEGFDGRLVGPTPPDTVLLCRYEADGKTFRWVGDKVVPVGDRQQIVDDLRSVPRADATPTVCLRRGEPTPFVLVMSVPDDVGYIIRADADPTCAYAGAETTNGPDRFVPIGNDLLRTWETGRWAGVTS